MWGHDKKRILVIGNGGGGKTTLARAMHDATKLPLIEVDQLQFQPGWERTPEAELTARLTEAVHEERWIIDGFGPWPTIEARAERADTLVFVDHPIWVHFWWAAERQIAAARGEERVGGPEGCPLSEVTEEMFRTIGWVHEELRPKLIDLIERYREGRDVIEIHSPEELDEWLERVAAGETSEPSS